MAEIRPFRGVHYNQSIVKDLAAVICPPYDVIPPQMQQELHTKNKYNFIRVEHARELPQDTATDNKYTRSAATFEQWLKQGILIADETPSIYLHDFYFIHQGKEYRRRSIIVRVRLEEWDKGIIHPHEGTLAEPKSDRLNLLWACQANTSPILALFKDEGQKISALLAEQERKELPIQFSSPDGERHNIWTITNPRVINQICDSLASQSIYIADGHHRYESSLTYRRERQAQSSSTSENEAFNFAMMALVDFSDSGLLVLSPHRLVRGISKSTMSELSTKLRAFFEIEELPLSTADIWQQVTELLASNKPEETRQIKLVLFGLTAGHLSVLTLRDFASANQLMPYFHSELYKRLDVSIIDHVILGEMLGFASVSEQSNVNYTYSRLDAINRILDQEYQLSFLISPVKVETIKAIADIGDRMPRKSTYFYPKQPAGLVINHLV